MQPLFEDNNFGTPNLRKVLRNQAKNIVWLRPYEITNTPRVSENGFPLTDVNQGYIGTCWILAAIASASKYPELLDKVFPPGQSFDNDNYTGRFTFLFWKMGQNIEINIDDRLPCLLNSNGEAKLVFARAKNKNVFWCALFEKALAKYHGNYSDINEGFSSQAIHNLFGGVIETFNIRKMRLGELWTLIQPSNEIFTFISFESQSRKPQRLWLKAEHSYCVLQCVELQKLRLVSIYDPWGSMSKKWRGPWNDQSKLWNSLAPEDKPLVGDRRAGVIWIEIRHVKQFFALLERCNISPTHTIRGSWTSEQNNSGGPRKNVVSYIRNPQHIFHVGTVRDSFRHTVTVHFSVDDQPQLKGARFRLFRTHYHGKDYTLEKLDSEILKKIRSLKGEECEEAIQGYTFIFELMSGRYILIPSTRKENEYGNYLFQIAVQGISSSKPEYV